MQKRKAVADEWAMVAHFCNGPCKQMEAHFFIWAGFIKGVKEIGVSLSVCVVCARACATE